jgi:hypothetical protein
MIRVLRSSGPNSSLGAQAGVFDRFVGAWDLDSVFYDAKGESGRFTGEWIFGWALDGKLVQDVLVQHGDRERRARGTTLRSYDAQSGKWRIVWIAPGSGTVIALKGGAVGDRIVLDGFDTDGTTRVRWSFNNIQKDSFLWRGETSPDAGKTWRLEQEMRLKRRDVTASAKPNSVQAFEQLASLVGEWKGTQGDTEIKLTYTVVASGSVLMEESRPAGQEAMVTMFSVDGDHILATHYCSVRNQPHMTTGPITESPGKTLAFSLTHVTGMNTPGDWHNTGLTVTLEDQQHLTQVWTYEYEGKKGANTFHFTRTR